MATIKGLGGDFRTRAATGHQTGHCTRLGRGWLFCYVTAGIVLAAASFPLSAPADRGASCSNGNVDPFYDSVDTVLSGDLFVTSDVRIRSGINFTLEAGTHVTMCGEFDIRVESGAAFIAVGTAGNPIVFDAEDPASTNWGRLFFNFDVKDTSILQHVQLNDGGSGTANPMAALFIDEAQGLAAAAPVIDEVTITNSASFGMVVDVTRTDGTPPQLTNLTITGSANAPIRLDANALGGLGGGNTFSGNNPERIVVLSAGNADNTATWSAQPIPYEIASDLSIDEDIGEVTITVEPGAEFLLGPEVDITVTDGAGLVAVGTPAEPITFEAVDPGNNWGRIHFSANVDPATMFRHVILNNGGFHPTADPYGALYIREEMEHPEAVPVIDRVTITGSASYGIVVESRSNDRGPPTLSNLTITGSAEAPLRLEAQAVGGLVGEHTFTGNAPDRIHVGWFHSGLSSRALLRRSQTWRNPGIPYEITGPVTVVQHNDQGEVATVLTVEAGTEFRIHPDVGFDIGGSGSISEFVVEGTTAEPVIFDRLDEFSDPWGRIKLSPDEGADSRVSNAIFRNGGGVLRGIERGVLELLGNGTLSLKEVTLEDSTVPGVFAKDGAVIINGSRFENNQTGVRLRTLALIRNSTFLNNPGGGVVNAEPNSVCVDALGNFWGDGSGPADSSGELDACNLMTTNAGAGDAVSGGVMYQPWLAAEGVTLTDGSSIALEPFWVISDGVDASTITVTLRDGVGGFLAGRDVIVNSTVGSVVQPASPTDENGVTTASLTGVDNGVAVITAHNVTDDVPVGAIGAVVFWNGLSGSGGLIDPSGVPYVSPQLVVEGQPFQQGFPMTFTLPMQNANPVPAEVEVTYSVIDFGIGPFPDPLAPVSNTLQPGEAWDAPKTYFPPSDGHRCVRADVTVTLQGRASRGSQNPGPYRKNFDTPPDPCNKTDTTKLIPRSGGVSGARKHFQNATTQTHLVNECLNTNLAFRFPAASRGALREYQIIADPPLFTPPELMAGDDVTPEQATAGTAVADASATLHGLDVARQLTSQRVRQAGQAGDENWAHRQNEVYRDYQLAYADALEELEIAVLALLDATQGAGEDDFLYTSADLAAYLADLQANGYDAETVDFFTTYGLSMEQIEAQRAFEIADIEASLPEYVPISFYDFLALLAEAATERAAELRTQYENPVRGFEQGLAELALTTMEVTFDVTNPDDMATRTIELVARPVEIPLDWTYALDNDSLTLDPLETMTATLTLDPGQPLAESQRVRVAVEGYLDGELIGGVLFERSFEAFSEIIFVDGFELQ